MISVRFGVVVALLLSVVALVLAVAAFALAVRSDGNDTGRPVQTRLNNMFEGEPVVFLVDEFYFSRDSDGKVHALYLYPPGFFGHTRGCRVVWLSDERLEGAGARENPGFFVDPCGGARFARDGRLVAGSADRGLDYFATSPGVDGIFVDTRTLFCGPAYEPEEESLIGEAPSEEADITPAVGVDPPPGAPPASPTLEPTATHTPSPTSTPDATRTARATAGPEKCDRVSSNTRR